MSILRCVKIKFSDDSELITNMSAHLTDEQIKDYYMFGNTFNVGSGENDKIVKVSHIEIIK